MNEPMPLGRRDFLRAASAVGLGAGLGPMEALAAVTPDPKALAAFGPEAVKFRPEIEPVVKWIEDVSREKAFEKALAELKAGLSYRDFLAGLFLAGIRNVKPRPVGFKFHAVMVMHSAHLLAQQAAPDQRLLPLFWALDNFKGSQAQDVKEGDWVLAKIDESKVPSPSKAKAAFTDAMEKWDSDAADVAVAGLCRSTGAAETMEAFWTYAVRDQRNIGHKPIFASQCWRTLQAIGWEHAEPVLRSLAYGTLDLQGDQDPVAVGPYLSNVELAKTFKPDWTAGKPDAAATRDLAAAIREAKPEDASKKAAELINKGVAPGSIWDAVALVGNELLLRKPGIVGLHAVTSTNSLHYIYGASGNDTTRRLALLQAVGWLPLYRDRDRAQAPTKLDALEPVELKTKGEEALAEIFDTIQTNRTTAAGKAISYFAQGGSPALLFAAARRAIFQKGRDSHDYKYGAAAWEECLHATDPKWQAPLAAAILAYTPGSNAPESPLMKRAKEAVAGLKNG